MSKRGNGRAVLTMVLSMTVIAGCSGDGSPTPPPATGSSPAALHWADIDFPPVVDVSGAKVVAGPQGFLVVAPHLQQPGVGTLGSVVLHSPDGLVWTPVTLPPDMAGLDGLDVAGGEAGYLLVGHLQHGNLRIPVAATSRDGRDWTPAQLPTPGATDIFAADIAVGPGGFLLDESRFSPVAAEGVIVTSTDGEVWTEHSTGGSHTWLQTHDGLLGVADHTWITSNGDPWDVSPLPEAAAGWKPDPVWTATSVALDGGTLLMLGAAQSTIFGAVHGTVVAWWSADDLSWTSLPTAETGWPFINASDTPVRVGGGGGLAAVMFGPGLYTSTDGWRWTAQVAWNGQDPPMDEIDSIASDGTAVVVAGVASAPRAVAGQAKHGPQLVIQVATP